MGAINVKHTGSGADIALSSDGTSLLLDGTAIGGSSIGGNTGVDFNDNVKARFGTGNDLQIYHTGSGSVIEDTGFGPLHFKGSTSIDFFGSNGEYMAYMVENGAVGLYHDGSQKLNTTSSGIQTTGTVNVNNAYTLPTADGTANQVLTTDGSGAVTFATAGGGADLYVANESSPAAQPTAAGANAIGIGDTAQAAGADGVAIGLQSYARAQSALGLFGDAQNTESICIGKGSAVTADGGVQLGRNGYATAVDAVSLGKSRASGASSFAAAIDNNTSSYGASGTGSVAIGTSARAYSTDSLAIGLQSYASGTKATALGFASSASGTGSIAIGNSTATAFLGSSFGEYALSDSQGKYSYASGRFGSTEGSAQTGTYVLRADTTDATPEGLTTRNNGGVQSDNQVNLPNNSVYGFTGIIIAREDSAATNDFAVWEVKGGAVRAASASTTALGSYNINKISESTGAANWSIAISADTTNGAIAFTVTGEASHSIRWVATINTTEVIY